MVDGVRYAVLAAVLQLAAPALAAAWNEIEGTANADDLRGTAATDRIRGLEGNDALRGWGGDDRLVGGPGDDLLKGGLGQDTHICGGGQDVVVVDSSRYAEHFGDGCEAVIVGVIPEHPPDGGAGGTAFRS
jgi:Ca2+-binding RTX toxin-like protein